MMIIGSAEIHFLMESSDPSGDSSVSWNPAMLADRSSYRHTLLFFVHFDTLATLYSAAVIFSTIVFRYVSSVRATAAHSSGLPALKFQQWTLSLCKNDEVR
ncbi:MAG: hypothetical protein SOX70_06175 [Peptoniphilaceae bacterium]|nr:hypothetical protein [Peptoniphilaceae bacterium]